MKTNKTVTGSEAAAVLGITFSQFKVMVWRAMGREKSRPVPTRFVALPIEGTWSNLAAVYLLADIRKMKRSMKGNRRVRTATKRFEAASKMEGTKGPELLNKVLGSTYKSPREVAAELTSEGLVETLKKKAGVTYHAGNLRRVLAKAGFSAKG